MGLPFFNEVMTIKRIIALFLSAVVALSILATPVQTYAATADAKAGIVSTSGGKLNVRNQASSSSAVVTTLNKGSYITLLSKSGSWWRVEYAKGQYGYCHSDYVTAVYGVPATIKMQSGSLNVRSGPGTSYAKTGGLSKGETVIAFSTVSGWSHILYHGTKTGYVSGQYLWGSTPGYPSISLNVPSFKQTDSRWANALIGQSGKTMAKIGCATTAIAMMESYRTGKTIYPDAMSKQLRYTASGSVYWPSHFVPVTSASGYLKGIYNQLKQGKPVLLGAKNSYGSQHWVVVTGYTGGSTLSAAGFTIRDPGSNSRVTMQQFLDVYPTFYKYFYY